MNAIFGPATFAGLGLVALWFYVRFPSRRPTTTARAMLHVVAAILGYSCMPLAFHAYRSLFTGTESGVVFVLAVLMPALWYVLMTWIWLLATIVDRFGPGKPRGGHRVTANAGA